MTVAHIYTVAFLGIEARGVDVQVHIGDSGNGLFNIVGLADKAVAESRERVRAALAAIGLALPFKRITVNLAPADLPKEGSHYDLPIALGLLAAMGVLPASEIANYVALGELSLDAAVTMVAGVLPAALAASQQNRGLICPAANGAEAAWAGGIEILATPSLIALVNHMKGVQVLNPPVAKLAEDLRNIPDLRDVKGQETARRPNAARITSRAFPARCSTVSIFMSMWQMSPPPILPCRRPPKAAPRWRRASRTPAPSSLRAMKNMVFAPMPKPKAKYWTVTPRPMRRVRSYWPRPPIPCG